jgi:ubiquinol oxidase
MSVASSEVEPVPEYMSEINKYSVTLIKNILSLAFGDRDIARFYALETIARVPYFAYTSLLHLYETTGKKRCKEYMKIQYVQYLPSLPPPSILSLSSFSYTCYFS